MVYPADWCNTNCNFDPPHCPDDLCECDDAADDDHSGPVTTAARVGGYLLLDEDASAKLAALASNASTVPVNTIWVAFARPDMVYQSGSETLEGTGLNISSSDDFGFAELKSAISALQAGGVDIFLSMGGWNFNCFPYAYTRYSVGGYGPPRPSLPHFRPLVVDELF